MNALPVVTNGLLEGVTRKLQKSALGVKKNFKRLMAGENIAAKNVNHVRLRRRLKNDFRFRSWLFQNLQFLLYCIPFKSGF